MITCFFCGVGSRFDNQMKTITINVRTAHSAEVDRAETATSYLVSLMCGERTARAARELVFSAVGMRRPFRTRHRNDAGRNSMCFIETSAF